MSCLESNNPKYLKRSSPPIPANDCDLGTISNGNDGKPYQIVGFNSKSGVSYKWVSCKKSNANCGKLRKSISKTTISKSKSSKIKFYVTGKVKFIRILKERSIKNPSNRELYNHLKSKKRYIDLVDNIAEYQFLYDKILDPKIHPNLTISFTLQIDSNSHFSLDRKKSYNFNKDIPSQSQVKQDLVSNIENFGDGCYGGDIDNECHYPVLQKGKFKGELFGELTISNLKVSLKKQNMIQKIKTSKPTKKLNQKTCTKGKVLSPKGRCVIDRVNKKYAKVLKKSIGCNQRFEKQYISRPGPPYSANECPINTLKSGNNGLMYVAKAFNTRKENINKWVEL